MHDSRVYITNGLQDKASFVHSGVRYHQVIGFENNILVKYDIQVKKPGTEAHGILFSAEFALNMPGSGQQIMRGQVGEDFDRRVDKPVLIHVIDRFRTVKWRTCRENDILPVT
jgi:hypothetical protein